MIPAETGVDPPEGVLQVPELIACAGCCYFTRDCGCTRPFTPKKRCYRSHTIFIEDTPEAKAAYAAARLEQAK